MKILDYCYCLDCNGLSDPVPLIKAKLLLDKLYPGSIMKMNTTDQGTISDIECWSKKHNARIIASKESQGEFTFYIEKK